MASPGNRHCANCIGALSFPIAAECGSELCDNVTCMNGAECQPTSADDVICRCPLGTVGDRCQTSK